LNQPIEPVPTPTPVPVREFVERPKSLAELKLRPNFVTPFKVTPETKLVDVIVPYSWETLEHCGLSTCKKKHFDGYLVITSGGAETNIGHKCGKNAFGIDFKNATDRYARDEDRRRTVERALELQSKAPQVKKQILDLANRDYGVRWVYSLKTAVKGVIGRQGFDHLNWRATRGDYAIIESKLVPRDEDEEPGSRRQGPLYSNETVGQLAPMEWLQWDFLARLFKDGVKDKFLFFAELAPAQMETKALKAKLKEMDGWEEQLKTAETMLMQAVRFLDPQNLRMVDLALKLQKRSAGSLSEWAASKEYSSLAQGKHHDGQTLG
jgi:hypothetical protein